MCRVGTEVAPSQGVGGYLLHSRHHDVYPELQGKMYRNRGPNLNCVLEGGGFRATPDYNPLHVQVRLAGWLVTWKQFVTPRTVVLADVHYNQWATNIDAYR